MKELKHITNLTDQILKSGEKFDGIMCCGRGGLVMTAYLAHNLDIKLVHHLAYPRSGKDAGMRRGDVKFLVVDDISDTGETLHQMLDLMGDRHKTAVLYERYSTSFKCDFVGEHIDHDGWIDFSWEKKDA